MLVLIKPKYNILIWNIQRTLVFFLIFIYYLLCFSPFLLDIFCIYISDVIPYPLSPLPASQPTHSSFPALAFPYTGA